ncbi:MAG TPA: GDP-L-fucose synthase [Pirellulales bacterium]|nr:GDP-L-fucose synthase [Pirellulales bacterium]
MQPDPTTKIDATSTVFVAGADTLIGEAIARRLGDHGYDRLIGLDNAQPDLRDARAVDRFFEEHRPEYVFLAAGKSAGIAGNQKFPAELMLDNLLVACHVIDSAYRHGTTKLLYVASSCTYPKLAPQPMRIESLVTGPFEPTNEAYATAKLAGMKLCEAYRRQYGARMIAAIPANAFGLADHFDARDAHVIPSMLRKMHDAKVEQAPRVELWGTGQARREFVFADDLADACLFVMQHYDEAAPINLGGGCDVSIRELAVAVQEVVGYEGELRFDATKPDGMPLKALESSTLAALGWQPTTPFREALEKTYRWFLTHENLESASYA